MTSEVMERSLKRAHAHTLEHVESGIAVVKANGQFVQLGRRLSVGKERGLINESF